MKTIWILILLIVILPLSGCQIFNPYDAKSDCPDPYNGDCVSMETAYRKSKADPKNSESQKIDPQHDSPIIKDRPETSDNSNISQLNTDRVYKHELYQEILAGRIAAVDGGGRPPAEVVSTETARLASLKPVRRSADRDQRDQPGFSHRRGKSAF